MSEVETDRTLRCDTPEVHSDVVDKTEVDAVIVPTDDDVLLSRGGRYNRHAGNKRMLEMVQSLKPEYRRSTKTRKTELSRFVMDEVANYGGRFLEFSRRWFVVDPKRARKKVSQALRETTALRQETTALERLCEKIEQISVLDARGMPQPLDEVGMKLWRRTEALLVIELGMMNLGRGTTVKYNGRDIQILHVAIGLSCPSTIILHALRMYPQQSRQRDSFGRLPLHVAVNNATAKGAVFEKLLCPDFGFPIAASIPDARGRLPLHLSIEAGRGYDSGLHEILMAAPRALQTRDTGTHLYPFMLAALGRRNSLDTVFRLLLESPTLIPSACAAHLQSFCMPFEFTPSSRGNVTALADFPFIWQ